MADSKPVKQEVNGTVILPPLVFPGENEECLQCRRALCFQGCTHPLHQLERERERKRGRESERKRERERERDSEKEGEIESIYF
jgi:hypothetical protein